MTALFYGYLFQLRFHFLGYLVPKSISLPTIVWAAKKNFISCLVYLGRYG